MDLKEFYWKDCRKTETATSDLMVHPLNLLVLDLPRKRYKHAHNGYHNNPAHSRNVLLILMSAVQIKKSPSLTLETWSFLLPFLLKRPSGRTVCLHRLRQSHIFKDRKRLGFTQISLWLQLLISQSHCYIVFSYCLIIWC